MAQDTFWYFGYGSLVNADTRPADTIAQPYALKGWRRQWRHRIHTSLGGRCVLTVEPCPASMVLGVLVESPLHHLAALDQREQGYDRLPLACASARLGQPAYIYRSQPHYTEWAGADYPILQSYVDCVVVGYLEAFGEQAAIDFIQTTDGWHGPFFNDRAAPIYPRAIEFKPGQQQQVDELLASWAGYHPDTTDWRI